MLCRIRENLRDEVTFNEDTQVDETYVGIIGIYHVVIAKHLPKYCKEFVYRNNTRDMSDGERFEEFLKSKHDRYLYGEIIMRPAYVYYNVRLAWEREARLKN